MAWQTFQIFAACFAASVAAAATNELATVRTVTMPPTSLACLTPAGGAAFDLVAAQRNGLSRTNCPSVGSGLAVNARGDWFGITDRGPNAQLKPAGKGKSRRVLPLPTFAPGIVRLAVQSNSLEVAGFIALRDRRGKPLSGRSSEAGDEPCFASISADRPLGPDPGGVDPEGIRCLPDGKFLLSEEYSPSLLVVAANGEVLMRYTPKSKPLPGAGYPVQAILPDALVQRRVNRGFECLALSSDGRTAYAILQSPLGDEEDARFAKCRLHRVVELDMSDPLNARVTGMFLLPATAAKELRGTKNQNQVKLNDAEWLGPRRLLVLEQGRLTARLLDVDLRAATNLLGTPEAESLVLEDVHTDLAKRGIQPAAVTTFLDLATLPAISSSKLEGLAILGPDEIALANDSDFGTDENETGESSKVWIVRLPANSFPARPAR